MTDYIIKVLEITFTILCVYTVIYFTGLLIYRLPDMIDGVIYLFHYLKGLIGKKDK